MNVLLINPPEYTFAGLHHARNYPIDLYNWATNYKDNGHSVEILDMYPELINTNNRTIKDGNLYYKNTPEDIPVVVDTGVVRKCGNYENEHRIKGIIRTGFPCSILEEKLRSKEYDRITVCAMGTKTAVNGAGWYYVFMGVYEVINLCKQIQPDAEVELMGEYAKICPSVARNSLADIVTTTPSPPKHFINTDLSLLPYRPNRISVATSHGCGNNCAFCFIPRCECTERTEKDPDKVLSYMENAIANGYRKFRFLDANMLDNWDNHLKIILQKIIDKGWDIEFTCDAGIEPSKVTDEIVTMLRDVGVKEMNIPLDNLDARTLESWGGSKTVEAWENAIDICKKYFDNILCYTMIGYPGQTHDNILQAIKKFSDYGVTPRLLPYSPIPGTPIYEDKGRHPMDLHPLLFPYASQDLTVAQIESLLDTHSKWYKASTIAPEDTVQTRRIYESSPAIPIN